MSIVALLAAAILSQSSAARIIAPAPAPTNEEATEGEVRQVCRLEPQIGTTIRRRVCRTVRQQNQERLEARDFTRDNQRWTPPPSG